MKTLSLRSEESTKTAPDLMVTSHQPPLDVCAQVLTLVLSVWLNAPQRWPHLSSTTKKPKFAKTASPLTGHP